jgi:hypothetical protein
MDIHIHIVMHDDLVVWGGFAVCRNFAMDLGGAFDDMAIDVADAAMAGAVHDCRPGFGGPPAFCRPGLRGPGGVPALVTATISGEQRQGD